MYGKKNFAESFQKQGIKILSASRVDKLDTCSWSYFCGYTKRIPSENNDGAQRGTVCHNFAELLARRFQRNSKYFAKTKRSIEKVLRERNSFLFKSWEKYFYKLARREKLDLDNQVVNQEKTGFITNKELVNEMFLVALENDFFGEQEGWDECYAEIEYGIDDIAPNGKRFIVQGKIDKLFIEKDKSGNIKRVKIVDYKTSKTKYNQKRIFDNYQVLIYQMFARDMFPSLSPDDIEMEFLFLRFPRKPKVIATGVPDEILDGAKEYLSFAFSQINNFTEKHAYVNFGAKNGSINLCGKDGFKSIKTAFGTESTFEPNWSCPYRLGFVYWEGVDKKNEKVLFSTKCEEEAIEKAREKSCILRECHYDGCPCFK